MASRYIFYGPTKIGITDFVFYWPTSRLYALGFEHKFSEAPHVKQFTNFEELINALQQLENALVNKKSIPYSTLVIDNIDQLETMICNHVLRKEVSKTLAIDNLPYSSGINSALALLKEFLELLDTIHKHDLNIVLTGHSQQHVFKMPTGEEFNHFNLLSSLQPHKGHNGSTILEMWSDALLFVHQKDFLCSNYINDKDLSFDYQSYIYTKRRPLFNAGSRFILPFELELKWNEHVTKILINNESNSDER